MIRPRREQPKLIGNELQGPLDMTTSACGGRGGLARLDVGHAAPGPANWSNSAPSPQLIQYGPVVEVAVWRRLLDEGTRIGELRASRALAAEWCPDLRAQTYALASGRETC